MVSCATPSPSNREGYATLLRRWGNDVPETFFDHHVGQTGIWDALASEDYLVEGTLEERRALRRAICLDRALDAGPAWYVREIVDHFSGRAEQVIVSNGDHELIESLLRAWNLGELALLPLDGESKSQRLSRLVEQASAVVIEDSPTYVAETRAGGALTIGVVHSMNCNTPPEAHFTLHMDDHDTRALRTALESVSVGVR